MTLDQLAIFVAVAEREHVTRAAESLNLTQSAVSGAIQALETRYDIALFDRIGRRIALTQAGRIFLDQARIVLRSAETARQSLADLRGIKRGAIRIHASQTTGTYWLPQRLARFQSLHPAIDLHLTLGNTDQVAAAVVSGDAEIGFVEGDIAQPDLVARQVDRDRLVIVVSARHPWARLRRLDPSRLEDSPWILRERGSGTRSVFEQALAAIGVAPDRLTVAMELPSNEAIRAVVEAGTGATAMSHAVVATALTLKSLRAVPFIPIERPYTLLTHRERTHSAAVKAFLDRL